jgi:hypothetical protein
MSDIRSANPNTFTLYDLTNAPLMNHDAYCLTHTLATPATAAGSSFGGGASVGRVDATGHTFNAFDDNYACTAAIINLYPNLTATRNKFRTPGIWNMDAAVAKSFKMPREGHSLRIRADFINMFNHANLYADPVTNIVASGTTGTGGAVLAHRGLPNCFSAGTCSKERRNIQLSAMYSF